MMVPIIFQFNLPFLTAAGSLLSVSRPLRPHGLSPPGSSVPWDSPGKNTGVGCHFLLQGIFPPRDRTHVSDTAGRFFTIWATGELYNYYCYKLMQTAVTAVPVAGATPDVTPLLEQNNTASVTWHTLLIWQAHSSHSLAIKKPRSLSLPFNAVWTAAHSLFCPRAAPTLPDSVIFHHGAVSSSFPKVQRSQRKRSIRSWRSYRFLLEANKINQQINNDVSELQ